MTFRATDYPVPIPPRGPIRILFNCIGRRIEMLEAFRAAARSLGRRVEAWATDRSRLAPGMHLTDRAVISPRIDDPGYIDFLVDLVRKHRIHVLVPLIDSDLLQVALARSRFCNAGCTALISSPRVVAICRDKTLAYHHLRRHRIPTPHTYTFDEILDRPRCRFPLYLKPRAGSAARGHFICDDRRALELLATRVTDPIVQEYLRGDEYTLDAYAGFDGHPRCVVPRRRIEVRAGEVSKGCVAKDRAIMALGRRVVESLADCVGVITIQCIKSPDRRIRVIEINPRFGGGAPLAIRAGADFPRWILASLCGRTPRIAPDGFRDGLHMLRYDSSVFCTKERTSRH